MIYAISNGAAVVVQFAYIFSSVPKREPSYRRSIPTEKRELSSMMWK